MLKELYDTTDNLINQQFYKAGRDLIIGRTPEVSLKITNSGKIIRKFKNLFNENIIFFLEGNYLKFVNLFKKIKGIDENYIKEIYQDLQFKFEALKEVDKNHINTVVIYSIVLNSIISSIRDVNFNNAISEIKQRVKEKIKINDEQIQEEIHKLFMRNNKNISILYNISYLDTLAESFHFNKVARVCKIQISKYVNRIVELIISLKK